MEAIKKAKYTGVKVRSLLRGMKYVEIQSLLTLNQKNIVSSLDNSFKTNKFLTRNDMLQLWHLFNFFVLQDKRNKP